MSELETIQSALEKAGRRQRLLRALRGLWRGLLIGAIASLALSLAYHFFPLPLWTLPAAAVLPFPSMALGFLVGGWRKPALPKVARWVDEHRNLQERLSTALEVAGQPGAGAWRDLLLADAAAHATSLDLRRLLPLYLPTASRWALALLVLTAGLGFVPEYRSREFVRKEADKRNVKEVGRQLAELTRHSLEQRPPALEPTKQSLESVGKLGEQLEKKTLTRSEALKDLASAADKLKDQLKELGKDPSFKKLEQAARAANGGETQSGASLQKQIESLQKQLGTQSANADALDKLQKDLEKLQAAARGMPDKNSPAADAERQKLSDALSALSKEAQEMGLQLPQLEEAIAALAANQPDLLLKDLEASVKDLEKLRDMAKTLQQLQAQAEKLGKDLAEQLKNGQPEAAQATLEKMAKALRAANVSPQELQKLLSEVSKAINPAGNYGEVAEHLKKAAGQMKSGDKPGASQSLQAAASELQKLMEQLGDAQQMMATLQAMNEASMCIGTGQGWRPGKRPGFAKGGKPGPGIGTWAEDDSAAWDGTLTENFDNSETLRPDFDPRSDRAEPESPEGLKPTRVTGKFSPGGQMPSITLKGVSIKGQSRVNFEEAATAAQSDAQSALSQEKVPRAYQGNVRDYFDDLKK